VGKHSSTRGSVVARLWAARLAWLVTSLDRQTAERRSRPHPAVVIQLFRAASVAAAVGILWFIYASTTHYIDWPPPAYLDAKVFNLTRNQIAWDVFYGQPIRCGETDCQLTADWPASNFTKSAVLPTHEFPLEGLKRGDLIYYRTRLTLPADIVETGEPLVLHSVWIYAERFELHVNGMLVDSGTQRLLHTTIPPSLLRRGEPLDIAFKIEPGTLSYQGINHFGDVVIGAQSALAPAANLARDIKNTYNLFHMLPRLTICLVFAFIFLAITRNVENFAFVVFAAVSSTSIYALTDLPGVGAISENSPERLHGVLMLFSSWIYLLVMQLYFRRSSRTFWTVFAATGLGLALFTAWCTHAASVAEATRLIGKVNFYLRLAAALYTFYLASTTAAYLSHTKKSSFRKLASTVLATYSIGSFVLIAANNYGLIPYRYGPITIMTHDTLLMIVVAALLALEYGQTITQRDFIKQTFRTFVDARVADQIIDARQALAPQSREVTVMFCDIRSFTPYAEANPPEKVFALLNEYLAAMVEVIDRHSGVIDKFAGDGIMAVWGSPVDHPEHAMAAARCAVAMRGALRAFNTRLAANGEPDIAIGIGLHTGRVTAGPIGTHRRTEFTVIGDTVNTAARIEALTKEASTDILISSATWSRIEHLGVARSMGPMKAKGKTAALDLYKLVGVYVDAALPQGEGTPTRIVSAHAFQCFDTAEAATLGSQPVPGVLAQPVEVERPVVLRSVS
jgi:class 3 adenylate cyclase